MTRLLTSFLLLVLPLLNKHGQTAPAYDTSATKVKILEHGIEENSNAVPIFLSSLTTSQTAPAENSEKTITLKPRSVYSTKGLKARFGTRKPGEDGLPTLRLPVEWPPSRKVPAYDIRKKRVPVIKEPEYDPTPPESPMPRPLKRGLPRDASPPFTESDEDSSDPDSDDDDDEDEESGSPRESPKREVPRAGPPKTGPSGYGPQTRLPRTRDGTGDRSPYLGPGMWKTGPDFDEPPQKRQWQDTRVPRSPYHGEGMWRDGKGLPKVIKPYGDFGGLNMNHAPNYGVPRSADDYPFLKHLPAMSARFFEGY